VVCRQFTEDGPPAAAPVPKAAPCTDGPGGGSTSARCNDGSSGEDAQPRRNRFKQSAPRRQKVVESDEEGDAGANVGGAGSPINLDSPATPTPRVSLEEELRVDLGAFLLKLPTFEDFSSVDDLRNADMTGASSLLVSQVLARDEAVQNMLLRTADGGSTPEFAVQMKAVRAADRALVAAMLALVDKAERTTHANGQNPNVRWFEVPFDRSVAFANNGGLVGLEGPDVISSATEALFVFHVNEAGLCHSYRLSTNEAVALVRRRQEIIAKHKVPSPLRQRPASSDRATPKPAFTTQPLHTAGAADEAAETFLARPLAIPSKRVMDCQCRIMLAQLRPLQGVGQGRIKEYNHFGNVSPLAQELTLLGALVRALPM